MLTLRKYWAVARYGCQRYLLIGQIRFRDTPVFHVHTPLLPNKVFAALFTLPLYRGEKSGLPKSVNGVETSCLRRRIDAEHYAGEHGKQQAQQNNVSSHGKRRLQEKSSCE